MEKEIERLRELVGHFTFCPDVEYIADTQPYGNGRINDTYLITAESGKQAILQRVNPIFAPSVLHDIDAVTRLLSGRGITTTELIPTNEGALGYVKNGECWRMLTYIEGRTKESGVTEDEARDAMRLIGLFHRTFAEHPYEFQHARVGFHDTPSIMNDLKETVLEFAGSKNDHSLLPIAGVILERFHKRPLAWEDLPKRIIHGDLKLSNVRFASHEPRAVALIDLDTIGRHNVALDVADAARSWANKSSEGNTRQANFDLDIFSAMIDGYRTHTDFLAEKEWVAIPGATAQIALELAARFVTDAYRESYFKLDRSHYPDLFTQNSTKASAQFALFEDIESKREEMDDIINNRGR